MLVQWFLQGVNQQLQAVHEQRGLPVLSFGEGIPTTINSILPKLTVSFSAPVCSLGLILLFVFGTSWEANLACCLCCFSIPNQIECLTAYTFMQVVPETSSYPGYGDFVLLEKVDHINVCKPPQKTDVAYVRLMDFLKCRVQETQKSSDHKRI